MFREPSLSHGSKAFLLDSGKADQKWLSASLPKSQDILYHMSPTVTAVMVDASFYLMQALRIFGKQTPEDAAKSLHKMALAHLCDDSGRRVARLYRIFVYDAGPASWKGETPIGRKSVNLLNSGAAKWRKAFHAALCGMRKVALRTGELSHGSWQLKKQVLKDLIDGNRRWEELTDDDFHLDLRQKGVDVRLGLDIASLAYKRLVNQIVLVSGDADFVPAAKLARQEGIDFVLDPMWAEVRQDLYEHIDGLRTVCPRIKNEEGGAKEMENGNGD